MSKPPRHGAVLRALHWITAGLVGAQVSFAALNVLLYLEHPRAAEFMVQAHLSTGAVLLFVVVVRLAVRALFSAQVAPPVSTGFPQLVAATHTALYAFLILLPILGYVRLGALGFEISLLGLVALPPIPVDIPLARMAATAHLLTACALLNVLLLHIAGAVFHRRLFGTDVLRRMFG